MRIGKKVIWILLSSLMALSLVLASCTATTEEEEEEEEEIVVEEEEEEEEEGDGPPVGGDWWDKWGEPEYGGTITAYVNRLKDDFDVYNPFTACDYWYERMVQYDWVTDRDEWSFKTQMVTEDLLQGWLMESWEWQDSQTLIFKVREGILWWDKPPANGREFTSEDVVYHYDRLLGTGSGFDEPNPFCSGWIAPVERVTASDKYTVIMKFKGPYLLTNFSSLTEANWIESRESVELGASEWENVISTGAFILTDYVVSSSVTMVKNTNYWGFDERHPDNRLPYADTLKIMCIPDQSTGIAALRTGKIDIMSQLGWEQAKSIGKTNPEMVQIQIPAYAPSVEFRCDMEPFTDINVRKALQMAIDRETIAETHYGGVVSGKPCGGLTPEYKGWAFAYDEWPEELKAEYSYNPDRARQLLAEAGYPEGFKTDVVTGSDLDLDLLQIIKDQFLDIGVDMDINVMERSAAEAYRQAGKHEQLSYYWLGAQTSPVAIGLYSRVSTNVRNYTYNNDPAYEAMYEDFTAVATWDEARQLAMDMDRHWIEQHWQVVVCPTVSYTILQPYYKGYSGESMGPGGGATFFYARCWVDQDLKDSMGR